MATREARRARLQQFLVMKAFNLRARRQTLHQQLAPLKRVAPDESAPREFLELDELCAFLDVPPARRAALVEAFELSPPTRTRVDYRAFVRFLQAAAAQAAAEERTLRRRAVGSDNNGDGDGDGDSRPPPPLPPAPSELAVFQPAPALLPGRSLAPGLWKKREVTVQERTTEYTKIDELGRAQRLVERERHQSEVLHMESLAGEFAHREITQFEQTEHLNGELVHADGGREEFLHLKSQHDELSRFDAAAPTAGGGAARPDECEPPPPSPSIKRDPSAFRDFGAASADADADADADAASAETEPAGP